MIQNLRAKAAILILILSLPLFVFPAETSRKMLKEGEKVFSVYSDQSGTEVAREECQIPKDLGMTLTVLSFSPYYGIKAELISGAIPDGSVKIFDEDGILRLLETYKDGKRNGPTTSYFRSGRVSSSSNYTDGKLNGKLTAFSRDGKIASEIDFIKGEIQSGSVYGMEANKKMNIGEILGRFAEKRRLSGRRVLLVSDTENREKAKELKILLSERGAEIVTAGKVKKLNEKDRGADILISEIEYQFYDIVVFICDPKAVEDNRDIGNTLRRLYNDGKVLAAVNEAEAVLGRAELLVSRVAATPEKEETGYELGKIQSLTMKDGVVVSDRIVTASGAKYFTEFVSEIARLFQMD